MLKIVLMHAPRELTVSVSAVGVAVRRCLEGGAWGEAGNLSCVSAGGQEILAQVR